MSAAVATSKEAMVAVVRRALKDIWSEGNMKVLGEVYHPSYERHDPQLAGISGHDGITTVVERFREGVPDLTFTIVEESLCVGEDKVSAQYEIEGTQTGMLFSIPPTNRGFMIHGQGIWRIEDGLIREDWQCFDNLDFFQALGIVPCIGEEMEYKQKDRD